MHSWIFRNRRRLEAIYGAPSRLRIRRGPGGPAPRPARLELVVYEMIPRRRSAA